MSLGYASRLSYREDLGGQLGAPEYRETSEQLEDKITQLTELVTNLDAAPSLVLFKALAFRSPGATRQWCSRELESPLPVESQTSGKSRSRQFYSPQ